MLKVSKPNALRKILGVAPAKRALKKPAAWEDGSGVNLQVKKGALNGRMQPRVGKGYEDMPQNGVQDATAAPVNKDGWSGGMNGGYSRANQKSIAGARLQGGANAYGRTPKKPRLK